MADYVRRIKCDFNQAVLTELLWESADAAKSEASARAQAPQEAFSATERIC